MQIQLLRPKTVLALALIASVTAGCATTGDVDRLEKAVSRAQATADEAKAAAETAQRTANDAKGAASAAQRSANNAQADAANAKAIAESANRKADRMFEKAMRK